MTKMNPGQWVRSRLLDRSLADLPASAVIQTLEEEYNKYRYELADLCGQRRNDIADRGLDDKIHVARSTMFVEAILLISYGRIDLIEDMLDLYKYQISPLQREGSVISAVVPMPYRLEGDERAAKNLEWFRANKDRLHWDSEHECFVLPNDKV